MKNPKAQDKNIKELKVQIKALNGASHNPVEWGAIVKLVAPVIARLATRYAVTYLAGKWNKRSTAKIRTEASEVVAERISSALAKQIVK